jgi:hypothetical protein
MFGGLDNDTYYVDSVAADVTEDRADGGIDVVASGVTFRLPRYVENLVLTGTAAINGTGNSHANILAAPGTTRFTAAPATTSSTARIRTIPFTRATAMTC